ncbi:MAG: tRNA (adenosine(37)-N6)-threonylcarbamoyltransferase complex dimerization subunit type 1 TsaB [Ignavibacterium sp.]|nr:tRNA (adenosine(37)-N6)-threonylcarbamoyltransferase complex dimerization subunit type 1 TsaB [Ignavibacterium sp.]
MNKPILAIETSDLICGACIYFSKENFFSAKVAAKHSHSEMLFKVIDSVITTANIKKPDINAIAVSEGPGSFTGLRIGMSAAKGLAFGLAIPIIPVPTFEALALQAASLFEDEEIVIANKVNTEEVYFAKFHVKMNNYIFTEELKIRQSSELALLEKSHKKFGNAFGKPLTSSPEPEFVAQWAVDFGENTKTNDIDNLEPFYLKNFIIKEKKNVK